MSRRFVAVSAGAATLLLVGGAARAVAASRLPESPSRIPAVRSVYVADARARGLRGTVLVEATLDAKGRVARARVLSGPPELTDAAIDAVHQWRFEPPAKAPATVTAAVQFMLAAPAPGPAPFTTPVACPAESGDAAEEGRVFLEVTPDGDGRAVAVRPVRGAAVLADAAARSVMTWRFSTNGEPGAFLVGVNVAPRPAGGSAEPRRVGGDIAPPTRVRHVSPVYPPEARCARLEGTVIIEATIGIDGRVLDGRILRSVSGLDLAALDAVLQWQFAPTVVDGEGVPVVMTVSVNFVLP
jgi:protein TonB